MLQVEDIVGFG